MKAEKDLEKWHKKDVGNLHCGNRWWESWGNVGEENWMKWWLVLKTKDRSRFWTWKALGELSLAQFHFKQFCYWNEEEM